MNYDNFVEKVKEFEGFRARAYLCPSGVITIGFGRTENVKLGDITNKASEETWLRLRLAKDEKEVSIYMKEHGYSIVEYQLQALTSFTYNCGLGNFYKLTDNGKRSIVEISKKIPEYNKGGGKVLAGLVRRRAWEKDLFDGKFEKVTISGKSNPTAKDLQELCNEVSGSDLVIDGKIGKKSVTALYNYIKEVST